MTDVGETVFMGVRLTSEQAAWVDARVTIGGRSGALRRLVEKAMTVDAARERAEADRVSRANATWQDAPPPTDDDAMFR